jgi:hypothetical protein
MLTEKLAYGAIAQAIAQRADRQTSSSVLEDAGEPEIEIDQKDGPRICHIPKFLFLVVNGKY